MKPIVDSSLARWSQNTAPVLLALGCAVATSGDVCAQQTAAPFENPAEPGNLAPMGLQVLAEAEKAASEEFSAVPEDAEFFVSENVAPESLESVLASDTNQTPTESSSGAPLALTPVPRLQVLAGKAMRVETAKVVIERARMLERAGAWELAEAQLRRAVKAMPRDVEVARALAQFFERRERWVEAGAQWREVLLLTRHDANGDGSRRSIALRFEAARGLRAAQGHLLQFWTVGDVVTLGADSNNLVAQSTSREPNQTPSRLASAEIYDATRLYLHPAREVLATQVLSTRSVALVRPVPTKNFLAVRALHQTAMASARHHQQSVRRLPSVIVTRVAGSVGARELKSARALPSLPVRNVRVVRASALRWEAMWLSRPMVQMGSDSAESHTRENKNESPAKVAVLPSVVAPTITPNTSIDRRKNAPISNRVWSFLLTVPGTHEALLASRQTYSSRR